MNDENKRSNYSPAGDDDELRRIIEELKNGGKEKKKQESARPENQAINTAMAFEILGISPDSDVAAIKSAYKKRMNEYHPDRVENLGEELKNLAKQKSQQINEAYNYLKRNKGF
jgi:DnaJ like chaperone protein